jgi:hypothetical protein
MSAPVADLAELLRTMRPVLNPGVYVFASLPHGTDVAALQPLATFREAEGLSVVVEQGVAAAAGLTAMFRAAWLSLTVHSDLSAIGLTAAVAEALTRAGISCNVVAAAFHDHLFVPADAADRALAVLAALQARAAQGPSI